MDKVLKKVEKMEDGERDRLRALLREKSTTKSGVDWMYKADKPEKEEYLLGRKIDKHIEEELEPPPADSDTPGALFQEVIARRTDLDMQAKMREDPLYAIHRKEEEARKRLLKNPIRMKQLQRVLDEKKKEEKKRRHKEKRRQKKRPTDDLVEQYLSILGSKDVGAAKTRLEDEARGRHHGKTSRPEDNARGQHRSETSRPEDDARGQHRSETSRPKYDSRGQHCSDTSADDSRGQHRNEMSADDSRGQHRSETSANDSRGQHRSRDSDTRFDDESRHRSKHRRKRETSDEATGEPASTLDESGRGRTYGLLEPSRGWRDGEERKGRREERHVERQKERSPVATQQKTRRRRLSAGEMERKRAAMMDNAKQRDEDREESIRRHGNAKEDVTPVAASADFIKPMMMEHASQSSVADRIKRNIYNIQRTKADMSKKFTDRH